MFNLTRCIKVKLPDCCFHYDFTVRSFFSTKDITPALLIHNYLKGIHMSCWTLINQKNTACSIKDCATAIVLLWGQHFSFIGNSLFRVHSLLKQQIALVFSIYSTINQYSRQPHILLSNNQIHVMPAPSGTLLLFKYFLLPDKILKPWLISSYYLLGTEVSRTVVWV